MCYCGNFRVVLVESCVACVVWGFCGILVGRHFYCRAVRCLRRGSGALRAGTGSVTRLVAPKGFR